jgi:hypothetical protein
MGEDYAKRPLQELQILKWNNSPMGARNSLAGAGSDSYESSSYGPKSHESEEFKDHLRSEGHPLGRGGCHSIRNTMMTIATPNWIEAHSGATHWDSTYGLFCNEGGFWDLNGEFKRDKDQAEWGTSRYVERPTGWYIPDPSGLWPSEKIPTGWDGSGYAPDGWFLGWYEWPAIGWHGQVTWGTKHQWLECVIMPDNTVAVKQPGVLWHTPVIRSGDRVEFKPLPTKEERERDETILEVLAILPDKDSLYSRYEFCGVIYDAGMLIKGNDSTGDKL